MKKPLALWCHARARSTAMGRMMFERGDHQVFDEPFARPYYFSDQRISPRRTDVSPDPDLRFDHILRQVLDAAADKPVFVKDHAYHVVRHVTPAFLALFRNSFLIRDPNEALPSLFARMPDMSDEETGYAALVTMVEAVERTGETPVVIDAADIVARPQETVSAWCAAVGLRYRPDALSWQPGIPDAFGANWWGDPSWHRHLSASTGFSENRQRDYPSPDDHPRLRRACKSCLPHYHKLRRLRLRIAGDAQDPIARMPVAET